MPYHHNKSDLILEEVRKKSSISQRELSKVTGLSLGLINVLLKKFVAEGHLQATHLNKRKMEYVLTSKGLVESSKRVYQSTNKTIKRYFDIESSLTQLLRKLYNKGYDYFSIHGEGELKALLENTFRNCLSESPVTLGKEHRFHARAVVLSVTAEPLGPDFKGKIVNVLMAISEKTELL